MEMPTWFLRLTNLLGITAVQVYERLGSQSSNKRTIDVAGLNRTYRIYVPADVAKEKNISLVFAFHGGLGTGAGMERLTRFSTLADREKFIVVYPNGITGHWNDGREATTWRAHRDNVDDVGFVATLIDAISKEYSIDPKRIFATGMSNGGIFCHYLAALLSTHIAAIAPVAGGLAERYRNKFNPEKPVSVFIIQGTADRLMPIDGGYVRPGRRGRIISTEKAVELWVETNGCAKEPTIAELTYGNIKRGCQVKSLTWAQGKDGTEVVYYRIEGGGHTWPGGAQYLPRILIGRVCRDFDATKSIWKFFKAHPR